MISTPLLSTFNSQPPQLISAAQLVDEMAASGSVSPFSTANVPAAASQAAATGSPAAASLASSSDPASQLGKSGFVKRSNSMIMVCLYVRPLLFSSLFFSFTFSFCLSFLIILNPFCCVSVHCGAS